MKKILSGILSKLGSFPLSISNKVELLGNKPIDMSEKRIPLHRRVNLEIKSQCKKTKKDDGKYLETALNTVDSIVDPAPIDNYFFKDYYTLKSIVEKQTSYFGPALLSVFTSITVSASMDVANKTPHWIVSAIAGAVTGLLVIVITWVAHYIVSSKSYSVIYPYLLDKMEQKIKDRNNNDTAKKKPANKQAQK